MIGSRGASAAEGGWPASFERVEMGRGTFAIARACDRDWIEGADLAEPERLLVRSGIAPPGGRGRIARLQGPRGPVILKRYRRGGWLAAWIPDLFPGLGRMRRDLEACEKALRAGVRVAAPVALLARTRAGILRAVWLVSEEVPRAVPLARALAAGPGREGTLAVARAAVGTVRRLHDAGILHRDLNLGNLLSCDGDVAVIDLDGARVKGNPSARDRFRNLSRLDRSYVKTFGEQGPLAHEDRRALLSAYCAGDRDLEVALGSRLAAHKRSLRRHALAWRRRP